MNTTSNSFDFEAPEEYGSTGGDYIDEPGTFHVAIAATHDSQSTQQKPVAGFSVEFMILAGTVEGCEEKLFNETFFKARHTDKEFAQKMCHEKIAALMIAGNLFNPANPMVKPPADALQKLEGQQLLLTLQVDDYSSTETRKFLQIKFADIFHVDDPRVAEMPKHQDYLKQLDATARKPKEFFAFLDKKKAGGNSQPAAASQATQPALNVDDI